MAGTSVTGNTVWRWKMVQAERARACWVQASGPARISSLQCSFLCFGGHKGSWPRRLPKAVQLSSRWLCLWNTHRSRDFLPQGPLGCNATTFLLYLPRPSLLFHWILERSCCLALSLDAVKTPARSLAWRVAPAGGFSCPTN